MSRKDILEKELKAATTKDNAIFVPEHMAELHQLFSIYADPRQRRSDMKDFLMTATTLGLDQKYQLVFRVLQQILEGANGHAMNFQEFIKELTNKIGNPFHEEGRKSHFTLLDLQSKGELDLEDLRYINNQLHYGYDDQGLQEVIHAIGGFNATTISWDKFNKFISRKVDKNKLLH